MIIIVLFEGEMGKSRDSSIDLIKFVSCFFIVILHGIQPGRGIQEFIYLFGSYGIPTFFLVNGFLRSSQLVDWALFKKVAVRYLLFDLLWSCLLTIPYLFVKRFELLQLLKGAILGDGLLFHFWFLTGIVVLYFFVALAVSVFGKDRVQRFLQSKIIVITVIAFMMISFALSIILNVEIRDVIPAPFRIITNGGYFLLGLHLGLNGSKQISVKQRRGCVCVIGVTTFVVWLVANYSEITWASSYYSFIPVVVGTYCVFLCFYGCDASFLKANIIKKVLLTSTGVWILHPFLLKALSKTLALLSIEVNVFISLLSVVIAFLFSVFASLVIDKVKIFKRFILP